MIELPEALTLAKQLNETVVGKTVSRVLPPTKPHKFCWFNGDPSDYEEKIKGSRVTQASAFGIFAELLFGNNYRLCINDGVNLRLINTEDKPKDHQLLIEFTDNTALLFTVAMYGGIVLHDGSYDNEYYLKSKLAVSPFSPEFKEYFKKVIAESKPSLCAKALIATEQRFPGIGNGSAQDILFTAGLHPKRKLGTLSEQDKDRLLSSIISVLHDISENGGRDTEKDLYGNTGGYATKMSKNALTAGCPMCGGTVTKEAYLGGSVYYCSHCQPHYS
jgi:formamidopyrimidine-DNA glycosylase